MKNKQKKASDITKNSPDMCITEIKIKDYFYEIICIDEGRDLLTRLMLIGGGGEFCTVPLCGYVN